MNMDESAVDEFGMPLLATSDEDEEEPGGPLAFPVPPVLERLEWKATRRGEEFACWAEFGDPSELTGADLRKLRKAAGNGGENRGEINNQLLNAGLTLLIEQWEIGYLPNFPIPSAGKSPAAILDQLSAFDLMRLEHHVTPVLRYIMRGGSAADTSGGGNGEPGTPHTPVRE